MARCQSVQYKYWCKTSKITLRNLGAGSFKLSWLNELAETESENSGILQQV
jgi:hypothetical protein